MNEDLLKQRTKKYAKQIICFCRKLPRNREGILVGNQLFRSGTSIAANYRSACRGRSKAEFISKLAIVEEEADEACFWLELIQEMKILDDLKINILLKEGNEIISMVVKSIKTARKNLKTGN